ncbi:hemin uptake protein HemP [Rhodalgimonas zhirmunskyi]
MTQIRKEDSESMPVHNAEALTGNDRQALITLGDQVYRLRITRAGKLILTK